MTLLDEVRSPALTEQTGGAKQPSPAPARQRGTALVDKLGALLLSRTSRRGFFSMSAVVGAAMVTEPKAYALTPTSAYASVCGPDSACSGGYTAFCCTINAGKNTCPPGSLAGGWWKADGSGFCCGGARYYIDCHYTCSCGCAGGSRFCGAGCHAGSCTCAGGDCDKRRVNCNVFRYGQCNTQVSCTGPVLCRVISCTPPWKQFNCSSSSATDNATGPHSASCLPGTGCLPTIDQWWWDHGGPGNTVGNPIQASVVNTAIGGGTKRNFTQALVINTPARGILQINSGMRDTYLNLGAETSPLGLPRANEAAAPGGGLIQQFDGGQMFWLPGTTLAVGLWGDPLARYQRLGGPGNLGYPISMGQSVTGGIRDITTGGRIYTRTDGASFVLYGPILNAYIQQAESAGQLGMPASTVHSLTWKRLRNTPPAQAPLQAVDFVGGRITYNSNTGQITVETTA